MKYFIINGVLPYPTEETFTTSHSVGKTKAQRRAFYKEIGKILPTEGEIRFLAVNNIGTLSVFVFDFDNALLLIKSSSQKKAYRIVNAFKAISTCFLGKASGDDPSYFLLELNCHPKSCRNVKDLAKIVRPFPGDISNNITLLSCELESGYCISHSDLNFVCQIISKVIDVPSLLNALLHLENSYNLFWGFMVGSFYELHYRRDRETESKYMLEKKYLENRMKYDLAFLSSFRGIEAFLDKSNVRKSEIKELLRQFDNKNGTNFRCSEYTSFHEIFSGKKKKRSYESVLKDFLDLRNAVAAHNNPNPPFILMEDQVFEIQYLLKHMISQLLFPETEDKHDGTGNNKKN